jgi:hypothetical protein
MSLGLEGLLEPSNCAIAVLELRVNARPKSATPGMMGAIKKPEM